MPSSLVVRRAVAFNECSSLPDESETRALNPEPRTMCTDWMNEGGQSSTGQLLDFMVDTHPASERLKQLAKEQGTNHFALLTDILDRMVKEKGAPFMSYLTRDMYLYPDLHGAFSFPVRVCVRTCVLRLVSSREPFAPCRQRHARHADRHAA